MSRTDAWAVGVYISTTGAEFTLTEDSSQLTAEYFSRRGE